MRGHLGDWTFVSEYTVLDRPQSDFVKLIVNCENKSLYIEEGLVTQYPTAGDANDGAGVGLRTHVGPSLRRLLLMAD